MKIFQASIRFVVLASSAVASIALVAFGATAGTIPEYKGAEARKHIGETARVTDKVDCVVASRRGHNFSLGDCNAKPPFWVVVHDDVSGPALDVTKLKGTVVTVTGKIDNESGVPRIFVTSTSQIVRH